MKRFSTSELLTIWLNREDRKSPKYTANRLGRDRSDISAALFHLSIHWNSRRLGIKSRPTPPYLEAVKEIEKVLAKTKTEESLRKSLEKSQCSRVTCKSHPMPIREMILYNDPEEGQLYFCNQECLDWYLGKNDIYG